MGKFQFNESQQRILEGTPIPFAVYQFLDNRLVPIAISNGFCTMFGYEREDALRMLGVNVFRDLYKEDAVRTASAAYRFASEGGEYDVVYRCRRPDFPKGKWMIVHAVGRQVVLPNGIRIFTVWYMNEGRYEQALEKKQIPVESVPSITPEEVNRMYSVLLEDLSDIRNTYYDPLTGVPTIAHFLQLAQRVRDKAKEKGTDPAMLFIDLSGMKRYNEKYGFQKGNDLLTDLADLLKNTFAKENCGRFGADHFCVVTENSEGIEDTLKTLFEDAKSLQGGRSLPLRVGIYRGGFELVEVSVACDRAKLACDRIRNPLKSVYSFFDAELMESIRGRDYVLEHFEDAMNKGHIKVFYQAIVRTITGEVCDEEALARWEDPDRGMLGPDRFVPVLEDAGLLYKLDLYVVDQIIRDMEIRRQAGLRLVPISVNLSWNDFQNCDMVMEISRRVQEGGIPPSLLNIEITENVIGKDPEYMRMQVDRFHQHGFNVWMDDFGSGYSSLEVLQSYDFDLIKFDMQFMRQFSHSEKTKIILTELTQMALKIGIDTLAEGVETSEQVRFLREIGVNRIQGFFFTRPIPLHEILRRYAEGKGIGFEDVSSSAYYDAVSKAGLNDPGITGDIASSSYHFFNIVPMSVVEYRNGEYYAMRYNSAFERFMETCMDVQIPDVIRRGELVRIEPHEKYRAAVQECVRGEEWVSVKEDVIGHTKVDSFVKKIAWNPSTDAYAILTVVLSVL